MDMIHIILASYQGEKYIAEQLDSIIASTYENWVITVCDDGSTDQTIAIVKEYQERYPKKIQLHCNKENLGHMKNFLNGARKSPYPYVMFCDQDDVWEKDKIELTYRLMRRLEGKSHYKKPIAVYTDACVVNENLTTIDESFHISNHLNPLRTDLSYILMENKLMGCTTMINRQLIDKLKVLPEHARFHDWWVALIAASFGQIGYLNVATIKYRQHGKNEVGNQSYVEYIIDRMKNFIKQRESITQTIQQAEEFFTIYQDELPKTARQTIAAFLQLGKVDFVHKRRILLKYHFYKTGIVRNVGVFLLI